MSHACAFDLKDPHIVWPFCPSFGASVFFAVLFALTTLLHISQAVQYRKAYCWVISASAVVQTICYIFRSLSIANPTVYIDYLLWFVLILIAPLFTNAFAYMVVARAIFNFKPGRIVWGIKPWHLSYVFVALDIVAFIVQVYGAASAAGSGIPEAAVYQGLHIYQGGVAMQQVFIIIFSALTIQVLLDIRLRGSVDSHAKATTLLSAVLAVLALITVRIIFRIVEYAQGFSSSIPQHEAFQYCLDSLPMLIALWLFNVFHPGRTMPGKESEMPGLKQRRRDETAAATRRVIMSSPLASEEHIMMPNNSAAGGSKVPFRSDYAQVV